MDTILAQLRPASILRPDINTDHGPSFVMSPQTTSGSLLCSYLTEFLYALKMPCIEAVKTYEAGKVSNEMTFLSSVMKNRFSSAFNLRVIKLDCLWRDIPRHMHCGEVGSNKGGLCPQSVSQYSPTTYCDELSISLDNPATFQNPTQLMRLLVSVTSSILCYFGFILNVNFFPLIFVAYREH
jgi:hypothetical protein